jgi:hypothetical protein
VVATHLTVKAAAPTRLFVFDKKTLLSFFRKVSSLLHRLTREKLMICCLCLLVVLRQNPTFAVNWHLLVSSDLMGKLRDTREHNKLETYRLLLFGILIVSRDTQLTDSQKATVERWAREHGITPEEHRDALRSYGVCELISFAFRALLNSLLLLACVRLQWTLKDWRTLRPDLLLACFALVPAHVLRFVLLWQAEVEPSSITDISPAQFSSLVHDQFIHSFSSLRRLSRRQWK